MKKVIIGLLIYAGLIVLIATFFHIPINNSWHYFGVPAVKEFFSDLLVITTAVDCPQTYESLTIKNCVEDIPPFNYPRIWLTLGRLSGLTLADTNLLAICIISIFLFLYLYVFKTVSTKYWQYVVVLLCSPATMLAINRANSDLIIFCLLVIAAVFISRQKTGFGSAFLLLGCVLKLYPIFALSVLAKRNRIYYLIICIGLFLLYCYLTFDDLVIVSKATPRVHTNSYGKYVFFDAVSHHFPALIHSYISINSLHIIADIAALMLPLSFLLLRKSFISAPELSDQPTITEILFWIGSSIYVGTFLIGNNWDYRLIFLHLTIPYLLNQRKTMVTNKHYYMYSIVIYMIVLVSWSNLISVNFQEESWYRPIKFVGIISEEMSNWAVYTILALALVTYVRKYIFSSVVRQVSQ